MPSLVRSPKLYVLVVGMTTEGRREDEDEVVMVEEGLVRVTEVPRVPAAEATRMAFSLISAAERPLQPHQERQLVFPSVPASCVDRLCSPKTEKVTHRQRTTTLMFPSASFALPDATRVRSFGGELGAELTVGVARPAAERGGDWREVAEEERVECFDPR